MPPCDFLPGMILAVYVGFSRLNHLQYLEREPMLLGILRVPRLPVQSTFWRFLSSLHLSVERQMGPERPPTRTGLGRGQYPAQRGNDRHRHYGAHPVWRPDGRPGELQPQEQRQA
jgi:hypothetical protein